MKINNIALIPLGIALLSSGHAAVDSSAPVPPPPAEQNLRLEAPITTWSAAIPLGNGLTGGLLWGQGNLLRLSLDRGDLWDERPIVGKDWWKRDTWAKGPQGSWEQYSNCPHPSKLPGGRIEITLAPGQTVKQFELDLAGAEGIARLNQGELRAFFSAAAPVAMLRISGPAPEKVTAMSPVEVSRKASGGWGAYSLSPTMTAWNAHLFYLHWLYTNDETFLRDRAYHWCRDVGLCMKGLLKPNKDGILVLPRTSSPEIHNNYYGLQPNCNYDLACLKVLFISLTEMATVLGKTDEAKMWQELDKGLGDHHTGPDGEMWIDAKSPLRESHRHQSNIIAFHPFNLITIEGTDSDRQRIAASMPWWSQPGKVGGKLGTGGWVGFSFPWVACACARTGDAEGALQNLQAFEKSYTTRNGITPKWSRSGIRKVGNNFEIELKKGQSVEAGFAKPAAIAAAPAYFTPTSVDYREMLSAPSLSAGCTVTASSDHSAPYDAAKAIDGDPDTRWAAKEMDKGWLVLDLGAVKTVGQVILMEMAFASCQEFTVECQLNGAWREVARGTTINGVKKLGFPAVSTDKVRINILKTRGDRPTLGEVRILAPETN